MTNPVPGSLPHISQSAYHRATWPALFWLLRYSLTRQPRLALNWQCSPSWPLIVIYSCVPPQLALWNSPEMPIPPHALSKQVLSSCPVPGRERRQVQEKQARAAGDSHRLGAWWVSLSVSRVPLPSAGQCNYFSFR